MLNQSNIIYTGRCFLEFLQHVNWTNDGNFVNMVTKKYGLLVSYGPSIFVPEIPKTFRSSKKTIYTSNFFWLIVLVRSKLYDPLMELKSTKKINSCGLVGFDERKFCFYFHIAYSLIYWLPVCLSPFPPDYVKSYNIWYIFFFLLSFVLRPSSWILSKKAKNLECNNCGTFFTLDYSDGLILRFYINCVMCSSLDCGL